jgi:hypothetical protein
MYEILGVPIHAVAQLAAGAATGGAVTLAAARHFTDWFHNREYETIVVYQVRVTRIGNAARHFERNPVLSGRLPDIIRGSNIRNLMTDAAKHCVAGKGIDVDRRFLTYKDDKQAEDVGAAMHKALCTFLWRQRFLDEADGIPHERMQKYFIIGGADSPLNRKKVIRVTIVNDADLDDLSGCYSWDTDGEMNRIGLETAKVLAKSARREKQPYFHTVRGNEHRVVFPVEVPVPV